MNNNPLLEKKFCDLKLKIPGSRIEPLIEQLYEELSLKGLSFKPHIWISTEWFTPDGVPGFAVPFYLINSQLLRLEQKLMSEAEGATKDWCLRLLRHETGHAIDNAYGLRRRKERQKIFGLSSMPYPDEYSARPYTKKYVVNLDSWYAQAHPDEDWAETFAVWLNPKTSWKKRYRKWPALKKLEYLDQLMREIAPKRPLVRNKDKIGELKNSKKTLKSYYNSKVDRLEQDGPLFFQQDLYKLFSLDSKDKKKRTAASFIRTHRKEVRQKVARWTGQYQYTIDQILDEVIELCREQNFRLKQNETQTKMDLIGMLTAQTMVYMMSGQHKIMM